MTPADVTAELRGARPVAPDLVRERVRAIVATDPEPRPTVGARLSALRPQRRRTFLALVPVAAAGVALAAGVVALVRPADTPTTFAVAAGSTSPTESVPRSRPDRTAADAPAIDSAQGRSSLTLPAPAAKTAAPAAAERDGLPTTDASRAQRTSVALALELPGLDELSGATQKAIATTRSLGGYVVSVSYGAAQAGSASLVVRIPTASVQDGIARLSSLGKITSQNIQIDDLQASLDAVDRQNAVLRNRIAVITTKLEDTSLPSETRDQLESTRRALREELIRGRQSAQATRSDAAFATVSLDLRTAAEEVIVPPAPSRLDRARHDALRILSIEGAALLYTGAVAVPLALFGAALVLLFRVVGRRQRDRLLEAR